MSEVFTAVDIAKLPFPDFVETVDFETIFAEMLADLQSRDPVFSALVESDPAYKILEVAAYRETLLRTRINEAGKATTLAYATGAALDHIGALFGVARLVIDPGDPENGIAPTIESDAALRSRIQIAPEAYSVAGPTGAYIFHAISADADVLDASAVSPTPGEVVVTVLSRVGDGTADAPLLATVEAALSAETVRPLTDHVTVQSATILTYAVDATIYTYAGPDSAVVIAESQARLNAYIADMHRIGMDVTLSGLYAALHGAGVQRVVLTSPVADIVATSTQATHCTGTTLTHGGVAA